MIKQVILFIGIVCLTISLQAQEKVLELSEFSSNSGIRVKESYTLPNQVNGELMLLLEGQQQFLAYLIDKEYNIESKIYIDGFSKYQNLIGYNVQEDVYSLFFTNNRKTKFEILTFNFKNKTSSLKSLDFKLKKEWFIDAINYQNKIYILSVSKNNSDLNIYTFNEDFEVSKNTSSLKSLEYKNSIDGSIFTAYNTLSYYDIAKIEPRNPNVIETTSKKTKIYVLDNQLILSFDHRGKETQLFYVNLDTFELTFKAIEKPSNTEKGFVKSNSYIFDDKIFQIASSSKKMRFTIKDLETKQKIKEYSITKEDSITFKNSPIIQEGGGAFSDFSKNRIREMEKTSKYLRKISSSNLGISVYKVDNEYNVILGGTKEINNGGVSHFGVGVGFGGTVGSSGALSVSFNPTYYGYGGYTSTKSTYINCLFDKNFDHLEGDIQKNKYDLLTDFEDSLKNEPEAVTVFLHKDLLHYGFFDKKLRTYNLYRFEE
ncbi:hypothetical protein [Aquimarina sp. 2201CG5-10]|uniref:hypothetical protein n=1 Tax=Aquimarina callyspongiae TaxID=3098150 RepID=UPI002AB3F2F8|nr:hypothetical protein [Aquimarina sp. 2201CG5-10]MDY8136999.1 hypothetical protein [Aquimarina sp. 2201CG5-10]